MLLRDEGLRTLNYVDLNDPTANWYVRILGEEPPSSEVQGRDLQLVGNDRVMVGTPTGYEEYSINTGERIRALGSFPGTQSAHRRRNRNTLLASADDTAILLTEVDTEGNVASIITVPDEGPMVSLVRETSTGTFLIARNNQVIEADETGLVLQRFTVFAEAPRPLVWQAVRLSNGDTVVATGHGANLTVFRSDGETRRTITGPSRVEPHFFAGFQVLANGNYLVTNWQGPGEGLGSNGVQLLEYNALGLRAWTWTQDAAHFSSLQGVILLDGLDTSKLHVEGDNGALVAVD